jgi:hypothetical protein
MVILRSAILAWIVAAPVHAATAAAEPRELTPADAVATVRIMQNQLSSGERTTADMISPDGRRYFIRLAYGDVARNGVWLDIFTGALDSLDTAANPKRCAHLFSTGLGSPVSGRGADADLDPANIIRWTSSHDVALLWTDVHAHRQVMSLDLNSCRTRFLTQTTNDIFSFAVSRNGSLLFNAQASRPPSASSRLWHQGFTLSDAVTGWSVLNGDVDGADSVSLNYLNRWFLRSPSGLKPLVIDPAGGVIDHSNPFYREVSISPSGRWAVIGVAPSEYPEQWRHYTNAPLHRLLASNLITTIRVPVSYALIDLRTGDSRSLWGAPKGSNSQVIWSPQDHLLIAPTFLPYATNGPQTIESDSPGASGTAAAELDPANGKVRRLPIDLTARTVTRAHWHSTRDIEITSTNDLGTDECSRRFTLIDDEWTTTPPATAASPSAAIPTSLTPHIHIDVRQDLNHPPQIFAVDQHTGASRMILDPNPDLLRNFKLGRVERMSGTLANGRAWIGQLMYPADYRPGQRYPLVIQSLYGHGFGPPEFTLDGFWGLSGMGLGPSEFPTYPGQLLATRNIAVLQLAVLHPAAGVQQAQDYQLAFETLAEQLSTQGIANRDAVALDGFSRNGYWVDYTLARTDFPFAAAVAADNYDASYFQSALANWREVDEQWNGGPAFGAGLQQWILRAPGFNADRIRAPLRMVELSGGTSLIIGQWEIYSRLRYARRPVEMAMMPDANTHPSHTPQNPRQIMTVQAGVIDWFSFWLSDREDPAPEKRALYARWRAFRDSRAAADGRGTELGSVSRP